MSALNEMRSAMEATAKGSSRDAPVMPSRRGVERNMSGPQGNKIMVSRRPPQRSKSHKIGRPVFNKDLPPEPVRGVNRNTSGRLRSAPSRTRSFGRSVPDRSGSGSLRAYRKQQQLGGAPVDDTGDDISVTDSVFTSASNQTLDSIMLRKKQVTSKGEEKGGMGMKMPHRSTDTTASFEFDEESLHTVDSINLHHRHSVEHLDDDDQGDLSVFSESFASSDSGTYDDDYQGEEGAAVHETEYEEEEQEEEDEPME